MRKTYHLILTIFLVATSLAALQAPDFKAPNILGREVELRDFRSSVVLLDFWATWCPPCRESVDKLKELKEKFSGRAFEIISISLDNDEKRARDYIEAKRMKWVHIIKYAEAQKIAQSYGIRFIPTFFLVSREGELVKADLHELEDKIRLLLDGKRQF